MADAAQTQYEMISELHTKAMKDLEEREQHGKRQTENLFQYFRSALQNGVVEFDGGLKQAFESVVELQQRLLQTNLDSTDAIQNSLQDIHQFVGVNLMNELVCVSFWPRSHHLLIFHVQAGFEKHSELIYQASLKQQENTSAHLEVLNGNLDTINTSFVYIWSLFKRVNLLVIVMWLSLITMATALTYLNRKAGAYAFLVICKFHLLARITTSG